MARTVLAASPNRSATRRAAALSQASPDGLFEAFAEGRLARQLRHLLDLIPQSGQRTRYTSITTVVRNSMHGRPRGSPKTGQ